MDFVNDCVRTYASAVDAGDGGHGSAATAENRGWTIGTGSAAVAGRGVVATKDYGVGDVIFTDVPLIVSPRVAVPATAAVICSVCYAAAAAVVGCPAGCGMPVCGPRCAGLPVHSAECRYVRRLRPKGERPWSVAVYNAIAPIRGLRAFRDGPYGFFLDVLQKKSSDTLAFEVGRIEYLFPADPKRAARDHCRFPRLPGVNRF